MGFRFVPTLRHRRRLMMRGAVYQTRLYPGIIDGIPSGLSPKQKVAFAFAVAMAPFIRPIDPAGRMDEASLKAWRKTFDAPEAAA
jgi:hypothetical protein